MKNATHRVVVINNLNSELVSQAILFLRDATNASETKIMQEAEKVVEKYMNASKATPQAVTLPKKKPRGRTVTILASAALVLFAIAFAVFLH